VPIYWGAAWATGTNAALTTQLDGFFRLHCDDSYMDLLREYSTSSTQIQHGTRLASARITSSEPGTIVAGCARSLTLRSKRTQALSRTTPCRQPPPTLSTSSFCHRAWFLYSTRSRSCAEFCGYHNHIGNVFYAVITIRQLLRLRVRGPVPGHIDRGRQFTSSLKRLLILP